MQQLPHSGSHGLVRQFIRRHGLEPVRFISPPAVQASRMLSRCRCTCICVPRSESRVVLFSAPIPGRFRHPAAAGRSGLAAPA